MPSIARRGSVPSAMDRQSHGAYGDPAPSGRTTIRCDGGLCCNLRRGGPFADEQLDHHRRRRGSSACIGEKISNKIVGIKPFHAEEIRMEGLSREECSLRWCPLRAVPKVVGGRAQQHARSNEMAARQERSRRWLAKGTRSSSARLLRRG